MSWPTVVIFQPPDGFEVPPVTMAPPVGAQPPAGAQPPPAVRPPVGAQPPPVAGAPVVAQAVTVALPVTTQDPVRLQPVLVTGQAPGGNVTVQVDHGPPIHAELGAARDPGPGVLGFSATVAIPDSPGPHVITATAVDDDNILNLSPAANVTVWVGPAFAIVPPALLVELYYPHPTLNLPAKLVGDIQQHLTSLQALAGKYGLTVTGPAFTLDTPPNSPPVLRIGLWITDVAFATVPASPPDLPLPSLSEAQAASCFGVTGPVLSGDLPNATAAVSLPTTTLQTLVNAASPQIVAAGARHSITVNSLTASTSPPNTVTLTADCVFPASDTGTIAITETLGTQEVSWESGEPAMPTPLHVPVVTKTTPSSDDSIGSNIFEIFDPVAWVLNLYDIVVGVAASGDAASKVSGIIGPLLAALPFAYPFPNTFITSVDSTYTTPPDFPVLSLDWTSFGANYDGVVGGVQWSLGNRSQDDVVLTIDGPIQLSAPDQAEFNWTLENLDPGSFTWTLTGDAQAQGDIVASPFIQSGVFNVPINIPNWTRGRIYGFTLTVNASETCASDPTKVLIAESSLDFQLPQPPRGHI
jgi:hypothetical protein